MEQDFFDSIKRAIKNWWVSLLVGIVSIILGIWCLCTPLSTFLAMSVLFVCLFFVQGILDIVYGVSNRGIIRNWGWSVVVGVLGILFGILLMRNAVIVPGILAYFIAFWLMFQSFWAMGASFDMMNYRGSGWGWLLAMAILGLIFSFILLFNPIATSVMSAAMLSITFIVYGVFRCVLAFKLKTLHKYTKD